MIVFNFETYNKIIIEKLFIVLEIGILSYNLTISTFKNTSIIQLDFTTNRKTFLNSLFYLLRQLQHSPETLVSRQSTIFL